MEDGGHDGDGAVHEGGWGDGDQGHTEGEGELRVFKVDILYKLFIKWCSN